MGYMLQLTKLMVVMVLLDVLESGSSQYYKGECVKDLLVILDTSTSVGRRVFNENVRPFLKHLINEKSLNVAPQGTHIAIMAFSKAEKTRVLLEFNNQNEIFSLNNTIDDLSWDEISGGHTRTDVALMIADTQVFPLRSPLNHRLHVEDVIMLITDGKPRGVTTATKTAINQARILKEEKGIIIVGLGVGPSVNMRILRRISSPNQALEASFKGIDSTVKGLVRTSCHAKPGDRTACVCPLSNSAPVFVDPGKSTKRVHWEVPKPEQCDISKELKAVVPSVNPGDSFTIGQHTISYVYDLADVREVTCKVTFEVKGWNNLCRGKVFLEVRQVCCCGKIHERKPGFQCCGVDYHSTSSEKCCPGFTIRNKDESCYAPECNCPTVSFGKRYIKPGDSNVPVKWTFPRPSCGGRLNTISPSVKPGDTFSVGVYMVKYSYNIHNQLEVTCQVHFEVKGCSCPPVILNILDVKPGHSSMSVFWEIPKPDCPKAARVVSKPPQQSGNLFPIGRHTLRYVYNINNQFDLSCEVEFEIRGALCRDKGFNTANQVCCCGTIHKKSPGYKCCGQDYYRRTTHKCCGNSVVRPRKIACPRQSRNRIR